MDEVLIALRAPVAAKTIERWVEERVHELRDAAWNNRVRLGDLWPAWQAQDADWLIEVNLRDRGVAPEDDLVLGSVLIELALLGLRPELLSSPQREALRPRGSAQRTRRCVCGAALASAAARRPSRHALVEAKGSQGHPGFEGCRLTESARAARRRTR